MIFDNYLLRNLPSDIYNIHMLLAESVDNHEDFRSLNLKQRWLNLALSYFLCLDLS